MFWKCFGVFNNYLKGFLIDNIYIPKNNTFDYGKEGTEERIHKE